MGGRTKGKRGARNSLWNCWTMLACPAICCLSRIKSKAELENPTSSSSLLLIRKLISLEFLRNMIHLISSVDQKILTIKIWFVRYVSPFYIILTHWTNQAKIWFLARSIHKLFIHSCNGSCHQNCRHKTLGSTPQNHPLLSYHYHYDTPLYTHSTRDLENSSILINTQSHHPANKFTFTMFNP